MKLRALLVLVFLGLSMMVAHAGSAQPLQPLDYEPEWLQQMYAQGWQKVEEGVLQRGAEKGQNETFTYGVEGLQWVVESYEQKIVSLEERYSRWPNEKLAELISFFRNQIEILNTQMLTAPFAEEFRGEALETCSHYFDTPLFAGPLTETRGVKATAQAFWHNECGYEGTVYAYAYAQTADGTPKLDNPPPAKGTSLSIEARAEAVGSINCFSEARAWVRVNAPDLVVNYEPPAVQNYSCPEPVGVTITGPSTVTSDYYGTGCVNVTWTASATGGTPNYTYDWYVGSTHQSGVTGSTLTKQYCNQDTNVAVRVVVTDARTWSGEGFFTTEVRPITSVVASLSGPTSVTADAATSCADVTWTASATGGHAGGYTYSWYIGTEPTVQGTGSTLTRRYCGTSQNVTAKVVASDSDGHTDDATFTTGIVVIPQVTASISGPAEVATDYYVSSGCANVTWTASATGGHPGYTYSWYVGTNTTAQGTGSTFTKSYCKTSESVAVKVVARDSDGHTDDATFTTSVNYDGAIVARITGPTSVDLASAASCADVTWTAGANGNGHSRFSYQWYIGTVLQGSGNSLTKRYCGAQTATVKLVATASDGHSDQDTHSTTINPPPSPVTASISGPTSIALATSSECKSITWTASATGGTPGYTYKWYIGTGTTIQGTTATLTKQICGQQTVNVKVVVTDSAARADDATHTTQLTYTYQPPTCIKFPCSPNTIDPAT